MSGESRPYSWWVENSEIDHYSSDGNEFFAACPVHGGSDSFHVTRVKDDEALVYCFGGCGGTKDFVAALEAAEPAPKIDSAKVIEVSFAPRQSDEPGASPLDWCAQRTGMTRAELDAMNLPLREDGDWLVFDFEGRAHKMRKAHDHKKKEIAWDNGMNPPLWPVPKPEEIEAEVTITEGEFDTIALRKSGYLAYSITGGSTNPPDVAAFQELKAMGVERVVVSFDEDSAGRKARAEVTPRIREAGLIALMGRPKGLQPLFDEKDARDVAARTGSVELVPHPDTDIVFRPLDEVEPAADVKLLLERLDPNDHTILFGDGGTGKGVIAAWWATRLVTEEKLRVLILDYENHAETEWRKRVEAFGGDMSQVFVVAPVTAIWDIAGSVAELIKELDIGYVIVDSALYACVGSDAYTPEAATRYSLAISQFNRPVLTLAHKTKSKDDQDKPFGSVFWHNGARLTISVDAKGYDEPREINTRKANHGADFHKSIAWDWVRSGLPDKLVETDIKMSATQSVDALILRAVEEGGATSRADIDNYVHAADPSAKNIGNRILALRASGMIGYDKDNREYSPKESDD